VKWHFAANIK